MIYNYQAFSFHCYHDDEFPGPRAGEPALDFTATTLDGKTIEFSDLFGKPICLETGSLTCPIYARNIQDMLSLEQQFPEVLFVLLYVREAHPGERISTHVDLQHKMSCAAQLSSVHREHRLVLVDDMEGTAHRLYGAWPDMVYVINAEGTVVFRGNWTHPQRIRHVLSHMPSNTIHHQEFYPPRFPWPSTMLRVLLVGGWRSVWDLIKSVVLTKLGFAHVMRLFGRDA